MYITVGTRVAVQYFAAQTDPPASLAGVMMKLSGTMASFTGTVRHIRGDGPTQEQCTIIGFWVQPDGDVLPAGILPKKADDFLTAGHEHCNECGCIEIGPLKPDWLKGIPGAAP